MIKFIFKITTTLILILIGLIVVIILFINPNNYKDQIISSFENNTSYKFNINGQIRWSLATNIQIYLEDLEIHQKLPEMSIHGISPEKILILKKASIFINPFKSLVYMKLIISKVEFEDLQLEISRHLDKIVNISELIEKLSLVNKKIIKMMLYDEIVCKNCTVNIHDQYTREIVKINKLNITLKKYNTLEINSLVIDILNNQLMLKGEAHIDWDTKKFETNKIIIENNNMIYNLIGKINYDNNKIAGNTRLQLLTNNSDEDKIFLDTIFLFDKQQIDFNSVSLKIGAGDISGNFKISTVDGIGEFDLNIKNIEITKLLAAINSSHDETHQENTVKIIEDNHTLSRFFGKSKITGRLHGNNMLIKPLGRVDNIDLRINSILPGMFQVNQGMFNIGKAKIKVDLTADINKEEPKLYINLMAKDLNMATMSKLFSTGVGIISIKASTVLGNYSSLINNLTGNFDLVIADGQLVGFDFNNTLIQYDLYLNELFNKLKKQPQQDLQVLLNNKLMPDNLLTKDSVSDFSVFKLQTQLTDGADANSNLILQHAKYSLAGIGLINLTKNHFNYNLSTKLTLVPNDFTREISQYMQTVPLIVQAKGSTNAVVFSIKSDDYILKALQELQKMLLKIKEAS